jgi:N-acetylmuramate 1-kinase
MADLPSRAGQRLAAWCRRAPIAGDASARRYTRLWDAAGTSAVLVEYPRPIRCQLRRDLEVSAWCRRRGLRVPAVLGHDLEQGWALVEDLGDVDGEAALAATPTGARRALLESWLEPLEVLAACPPGELPPWNPPLDRHRLRWELAGFELWYLRHLHSVGPWPEVGRWLDRLAAEVAAHPLGVCHRDFHLNNLLPQPGDGVAVIDVQDILVGPDTYDAVSLTSERAAVQLVSEADRQAVLAAWARRTGALPGWRDRAAAVALQRGLKVLGTFARFTVAGRRSYRPWLDDLAARLAGPVGAAGADPRLTALLLD